MCRATVYASDAKCVREQQVWLGVTDLADDYIIQSRVKLKTQLPLPLKVRH